MKKLLVSFWLLLGFSAMAMAVESNPRDVLIKIHDEVITVLERDKDRLSAEPEYLENQLKTLVDPYVDFKAMGRLMLGKHWKTATPEQRQRFMSEFRSMLARIYGKSIALYEGQHLEFDAYKPGKKKNLATIRSRVHNDNGDGMPIDFRLRFKKSDGWKIFDISVDGISLIKNYKSSFQREIAQVGIEGLLENISARGKKKTPQ